MNHSQDRNPARSAGILLYRTVSVPDAATGRDSVPRLQVYLVHPGGPYFRNKDIWGIAKGLIEPGEDERAAARREFEEETGFDAPAELHDLGTVTTHRGKVIHAFAGKWEQPCDPPPVKSNHCPVEWPPGSGRSIQIPEVDEGRFFDAEEARNRMHGCQDALIDRLEALLGDGSAPA